MADKHKPSGLKIARNKGKFTFSWKIKDSNDCQDQSAGYRTNLTKAGHWSGLGDLAKTTTSKSHTFNDDDYYPHTSKKLTSVSFRVRGKYKKGGWSDYANDTFHVKPPKKPKIKSALQARNSSTFTWDTKVSDTSKQWFTNCEIENCLLTDQNVHITQAKNVSWGEKYTVTRSSSVTKEEDTNVIYQTDGKSYTRWYRIRSRGPAGHSKYSYAYHVYGNPPEATVDQTVATIKDGYNQLELTVDWTANIEKYTHPAELETVQYAIASPLENYVGPPELSWVDGPVIKDTADVSNKKGSQKKNKKTKRTNEGRNDNSATFIIDSVNEDTFTNQCLFVRVNTQHDNEVVKSKPYFVSNLEYKLSDPEINTIIPHSDTYKIELDVTNTAASAIPYSKIAVVYRTMVERPNWGPATRYFENPPMIKVPEDIIVGIIDGSTGNIQFPNWTDQDFSVAVYAFVGTATVDKTYTSGGVTFTTYKIDTSPYNMVSSKVVSDGDIPKAPTDVRLDSDSKGNVTVEWDNTWGGANNIELSWSDYEFAWESTDEPSSYQITDANAARWRISNLELGTKWWIRLRYIKNTEESEIYSPWSTPISIVPRSAPNIPVLNTTKSVVKIDEEFGLNWSYTSDDGSDQKSYSIVPVTVDGNGDVTAYGSPVKQGGSETETTLTPGNFEWVENSDNYVCIMVTSEYDLSSGWSKPVKISVAKELTLSDISAQGGTSLEARTEDGVVNYYLTEMPLTITYTCSTNECTATAVIERADNYRVDRPDETEYSGQEGEAVAYQQMTGYGTMSIDYDPNNTNVFGNLDDTAKYILRFAVEDKYGQRVVFNDEDGLEFTVDWEHQAAVPKGTAEIITSVEVNPTTHERANCLVSKITPILPDQESWGENDGPEEGDVCDIYRLSADRPQLIVKNGSFGTAYVDPYPTIGKYGGHRIVYKTVNNDYITSNYVFAWKDLGESEGDVIRTPYNIINFGEYELRFLYNVQLSSSWNKDFKETKYLGGHVQGDWNPAVSRTGTVSTVVLRDEDLVDNEISSVELFRRLADYAGVCHVRTIDGSSYSADVQVSETMSYNPYETVSYSLNITRVDDEDLTGMTYTDWYNAQQEPIIEPD